MISAAAYILRVTENGRRILLRDESGMGFYGEEEPLAGEPVPRFDHSRRSPLVVLGCFEDDAITQRVLKSVDVNLSSIVVFGSGR
jgi:hypothetical protein